MEQHRFHLEKYHTGCKKQCPKCSNKACFTRYVDSEKEVTFPDYVGRCDHEQSCGYHFTPRDYFQENPEILNTMKKEKQDMVQIPPASRHKPQPSNIDNAIMERTLSHYDINPLYLFFARFFGKEETDSAASTGLEHQRNGAVPPCSGKWTAKALSVPEKSCCMIPRRAKG